MTFLLNFIENENAQLEKEKNEIKVKYHERPPEERNITKDILSMHTQFEQDLGKLKEISEDYSKFPSLKNKNTESIEKKFELIGKMQADLMSFHKNMQNLMMIKAKCQKENEIFEEQIKALDQKTQDLQ